MHAVTTKTQGGHDALTAVLLVTFVVTVVLSVTDVLDVDAHPAVAAELAACACWFRGHCKHR